MGLGIGRTRHIGLRELGWIQDVCALDLQGGSLRHGVQSSCLNAHKCEAWGVVWVGGQDMVPCVQRGAELRTAGVRENGITWFSVLGL